MTSTGVAPIPPRRGPSLLRRPERLQTAACPHVGDVLNVAARRKTRHTACNRLLGAQHRNESRVGPVWVVAMRDSPARAPRHRPLTGQALFTLTAHGRKALRRLVARSR